VADRRQEQIVESVDEVFCLKNEDVDESPATEQQEYAVAFAAECASELSEEPPLVPCQPQSVVGEQDTPGDDSNTVASVPKSASELATPERDDGTAQGLPEVVAADDNGDDDACRRPNIVQDPLSGTKRLPMAAASILRMPLDSIRRRDCESKESLGSASGDEAGDAGGVESPASGGPGLMSRTLGSITALPSLFKSSSSGDAASAAAQTPPSPRSAAATVDKSERSPGPTKTRTFFFHRFVGRTATDASEADTPDSGRTADDGDSYWLFFAIMWSCEL